MERRVAGRVVSTVKERKGKEDDVGTQEVLFEHQVRRGDRKLCPASLLCGDMISRFDVND